ncbi:hypothetical protein JXA40_04875 [bacterium]|nr:hypothetical protein [candidate division CSSED10-310 bacterium]
MKKEIPGSGLLEGVAFPAAASINAFDHQHRQPSLSKISEATYSKHKNTSMLSHNIASSGANVKSFFNPPRVPVALSHSSQ